MSFGSQDVRQAVLVRDAVQEDDQISERLALFDEATGAAYPFSGEEWKDIPEEELQNGWTYLAENPAPQFRKRPNGHVELRGVVSGGTEGTIFNLPEGYRHNYEAGLHFVVAGQNSVARFAVHPNGDIMAITMYGRPDSEWYSLASIMFSIT